MIAKTGSISGGGRHGGTTLLNDGAADDELISLGGFFHKRAEYEIDDRGVPCLNAGMIICGDIGERLRARVEGELVEAGWRNGLPQAQVCISSDDQ